MSIDKSLNIMKEIAKNNNLSEPYIVGGVPRNDLLEGTHEIHDIDITTGDDTVHELAKLFAESIGKEPLKHKDHFSVTHNDVRYDFSKNFRYPSIDDILEKKGIKNPTELQKESYSRDFYINTLIKPIGSNKIIDPTGRGKQDIENKLLECPVDCNLSFRMSPDRILRAFYFKNNYGFNFSDNVESAIKKNAKYLANVNPRHAKEMINKIVRENPNIIDELINYDILTYVPLTKYLTKVLLDRKRLLNVMDNQVRDLPVFKTNKDYGEGLTKEVDEARENDSDDKVNFVNPIEIAEYCDKKENKKYWDKVGKDEAAKDFQQYAKEVKCRKLPLLIRESEIRSPSIRECPFGLPITVACKNAGTSVDNMTALENVPKEQREKYRKANRRVYVHENAKERCPYADKIVENKDAVHCDWGESGARMRDEPMRPSPFYPRVFHGLGQYGLYSYPVNEYTDNHGARQLFTGLFSLYASTGEIEINKTALPVSSKAIIIKGNPAYIDGNPDADKFYKEIEVYLKKKGFDVSYDAGEPYTSPEEADVWIGHSRGVDRLQFAPEGTAVVALGAPNYPGVINHPKDEPEVGKEPSKYHYIFTDEMKSAIDDAIGDSIDEEE